MKRIETAVHIDAPPETVWRVLVDFTAYPAWSPRLTVSGKPTPGQSLRVTAAAPGMKGMTFSPLVLAAEANRVLRWRGRVLLPGLCDGVHEFLLTEENEGTRLIHAENFWGVLVPFLSSRALTKTEDAMREQNAALQRRVESVAVQT